MGKTAVTATMALAASRLGLTTLVVDIDGRAAVAKLFGARDTGYDEIELVPAGDGRGRITTRVLEPDQALVEYLHDHGLKRISNRLVSSGALDMVATATPGIRDVLVLGKIKQLERSAAADLILVDAPAAGHAISFLRSASGILDAVSMGPIETQAREVAELLSDESRCEVTLVTLPEETPINELIETAFGLEDRVGIRLGAVVVNGVIAEPAGLVSDGWANAAGSDTAEAGRAVGLTLSPTEIEALDRAARFVAERAALHRVQLERLRHELPLPQIHLPFRFTSDIGPRELDELATHYIAAVEALPGQP